MARTAEKRFILDYIHVFHSLPALQDVKSKDYSNHVKKLTSFRFFFFFRLRPWQLKCTKFGVTQRVHHVTNTQQLNLFRNNNESLYPFCTIYFRTLQYHLCTINCFAQTQLLRNNTVRVWAALSHPSQVKKMSQIEFLRRTIWVTVRLNLCFLHF